MRTVPLLLVTLLATSACGSTAGERTAAPITDPFSDPTPASTTGAPTSSTSPEPSDAAESWTLADFTDPSSVDAWYVQNDTVMGGVSSSELSWNDGDLLFSGNLSTDNNGGFTSMRGPVVPFIPASGLTAISVVAQGDGRTYLMQIRTDTDSYIQRFTPVETMSETLLALTDFTATDWRLSPIPDRPPLVSEAVRQVAVYLVDKQVGEFVLRLRSISMVAD